ncbi:unnamed protein product [Penicillium salamii]|nr:unnamed protein product [Penicillium salamii]CAG8267379.1 unnamed protein product [Penicillium salamii]
MVFIFDWRIRRELDLDPATSDELISPAQLQDRNFVLAPTTGVHADATEYTTSKRVKIHFPDEAEDFLRSRVQMINFWRPIRNTVKNWPLILCDGRTAPLEKLVAVDQVTRQFVGDVLYANHDPSYKWYYQSEMAQEEGVLFKSWDTDDKCSSRVCIHSSACMPSNAVPKLYDPRQSFEARALVFSE